MKVVENIYSKVIHLPAEGNAPRPGHIFNPGERVTWCGKVIDSAAWQPLDIDVLLSARRLCRKCFAK